MQFESQRTADQGYRHGRKERLVWLLSMSACAETNASMQFLTDASLTTSEQHKDTSKARQSREHGDTKNILDYFQERNPFSGQGTLRSLSSGRAADESVNVGMAKTWDIRSSLRWPV